MSELSIIELTAEIVSAHVSNNNVAAGDVPALIQTVHDALARTAAPAPEPAARQEPAVSIRASVKPDYIVCLEDGAKLKMLKRYLRTRYDMSPEDYRAKWGLPNDYPMVAPNYAEQRRSLAHQIGLGRKKPEPETKAPARKAAAKPRSAKAAKAAAEAHLATDGGEG
ncbi:MucR family transcriptional regulator [Sphingomonas morindae]|uniref:MucR family transcriptional regulator n=1 Tax=Sphingomonas morindae TaxID=1541170 RepID=A0ABY4X8E7_9SPHN|nr:MucR family transcriptional regulator [Sphingomonas morindae]USI73158.1 MucR family transcriptional regulator [Sphingomonas morindae]